MSGPWDIDDELPGAAPVSVPAGYDGWKLATPPEFEHMGPPPWLPPDAGPATNPPRIRQVPPKTNWTLKEFSHPPMRVAMNKTPRPGKYGTLHNYQTGAEIRPATKEEQEESAATAASDSDGGAGVILVDGVSCYVQD